MSTGVAPHKVQQLEMRALRAENEGLRLKLQQLAQHVAKLMATLQEQRTSMALMVAASGNRIELAPELLDRIDIGLYELRTAQDDASGALVVTLVERADPPASEAPEPPAAAPRPTIALVPR